MGTNTQHPISTGETWPALPLDEWQDTYSTLHMWTQIVGKIRMAQAPMINHWWQVPLYVTTSGLTTSPIPYQTRTFEMAFNFLDHSLDVTTSEGRRRSVALEPKSVAAFYRETMAALRALGIDVTIWTTPVEVPDRTPFEEDERPRAYDPDSAQRLWRILVQIDRVLKQFRARFTGKASPVHFFWGAFDIAATRFSGRRAPEHPGAPNVARSVMVEAYSHEVSSAGWWPGGGLVQEPAFYAYAYPEPEGFADYPVRPEQAFYSSELGEFLLPYEAVRISPTPDDTLLAFLQSTYEAAADLAGWDRAALERHE